MYLLLGKEMILRRYYGPTGVLLSAHDGTQSTILKAAAGGHEDRGFLNMAINHLQHNRQTIEGQNADGSTSIVVTNADINPSRRKEIASANSDQDAHISDRRRLAITINNGDYYSLVFFH